MNTNAGEPGRLWYLDTSVVLRGALGHSASAVAWFRHEVEVGSRFVTSRLTVLECVRVLRRELLPVDLADAWLGRSTLLGMDDALMTEAGRIVAHVKSLDAIHLASALRVGPSHVAIVTHDVNMQRAAGDLGFDTFDPVR